MTSDLYREKLAESFLPLIEQRVQKFVKRHPAASYFRDELVSVGNFSLAACLKKLDRIQNVPAYISKAADRALAAAWAEEEGGAVRVSSRTLMRDRTKSRPTQERADIAEVISPNGTNELLEELIAGCCATSEEREIVNKLAQGWTVAELSEELDMDELMIQETRQRIFAKYKQRDCE